MSSRNKTDSALEQLHHLARDPVLAPETVRQLNMLPAFCRDDASALAWRARGSLPFVR